MNTKPELRPDILFKDMGEEGILLNPHTATYFRVTPLGVKVLELVMSEGAAPFDQQIDFLAKSCAVETGVDVTQITEDIRTFLNALQVAEITLGE